MSTMNNFFNKTPPVAASEKADRKISKDFRENIYCWRPLLSTIRDLFIIKISVIILAKDKKWKW